MDLASILGLVLCFGLIIYGIINGESGIDFSAISNFIDLSSVYITIGGSISCMMASYELKEFLLSLEEADGDLDDEFLKKGILLIVDGTDPELVRAIMETELASVEGRHNKVVSFYERFAAMGPAWGMIGTLIGLVNMLYNMEDSSKIGPSMAVALLTTLYGSMIANWLCLPASFKMKNFNAEEMMVKEIMIEGLLSIQAGENPRVIEEKLKSFLSPVQRKATAASDDGGEE